MSTTYSISLFQDNSGQASNTHVVEVKPIGDTQKKVIWIIRDGSHSVGMGSSQASLPVDALCGNCNQVRENYGGLNYCGLYGKGYTFSATSGGVCPDWKKVDGQN